MSVARVRFSLTAIGRWVSVPWILIAVWWTAEMLAEARISWARAGSWLLVDVALVAVCALGVRLSACLGPRLPPLPPEELAAANVLIGSLTWLLIAVALAGALAIDLHRVSLPGPG
ncbi:MAG: hypothetical protein KGN02_12210 [bacterium]|nr:hypothetical protein [bacterium]